MLERDKMGRDAIEIVGTDGLVPKLHLPRKITAAGFARWDSFDWNSWGFCKLSWARSGFQLLYLSVESLSGAVEQRLEHMVQTVQLRQSGNPGKGQWVIDKAGLTAEPAQEQKERASFVRKKRSAVSLPWLMIFWK